VAPIDVGTSIVRWHESCCISGMRHLLHTLGLVVITAWAGVASAGEPSEAPSPVVATAKVALLGGGGAVDVRLFDRLYVGVDVYRYWNREAHWWTAANARVSYRLTYGHLVMAAYAGGGYLRPRTYDTLEGYQIVDATVISPTAGLVAGLQFGHVLVGLEGQFTSYGHTDKAHADIVYNSGGPTYTQRENTVLPWFFVGGQL